MRITLAGGLILASLLPVTAQSFAGGLLEGGPGTDEPLSIARGAGVFHGNYCGVGDNGPGLPPVDALDRACMHHDACTPEGQFPSCGCDARFLREVRAVALSARLDSGQRLLAGLVQGSIPAIPCRN